MSPVEPDNTSAQAGFTLIEVVCVLAVLSLLAAIVWPMWPAATSRPRLERLALDAAALLKAERVLAMQRQAPTRVMVAERALVSQAQGRSVSFPADVAVAYLGEGVCRSTGAIVFEAAGLSCGRRLRLSGPADVIDVMINAATGGVELANAR